MNGRNIAEQSKSGRASQAEEKAARVVAPRRGEPTPIVASEPQEVQATEYRHNKPVYRLDNTPSETLVIHCSSPRFQKAFRLFVTEELGIEHYTPIMIGGGAHAFGMSMFLPKNLKFLWEQIKFFVKEQKVKQIIIINHRDCQWYEKMKGYHPTVDLPLKGRVDLRTATKSILTDFAGVHIRSFYADVHGDEIVFEEVV
ncbi:MAG: hypothetical protein WCV85_06275 [Patescibacteria group bacterium]|jgi:hypothetical protein